jgi:two-component system chemotaxis response regulator CheY
MTQILIIDDAATMRLYYRSILEEAGYACEEAVNGIDGLEKALGGRFDCYVVDINMPMLDGFGFVRGVRREEETHAPALMISSESGAHDEAEAYSAGANGYMVKPARPDALLASIARLLAQDRAKDRT